MKKHTLKEFMIANRKYARQNLPLSKDEKEIMKAIRKANR